MDPEQAARQRWQEFITQREPILCEMVGPYASAAKGMLWIAYDEGYRTGRRDEHDVWENAPVPGDFVEEDFT